MMSINVDVWLLSITVDVWLLSIHHADGADCICYTCPSSTIINAFCRKVLVSILAVLDCLLLAIPSRLHN